MEVTGVKSDKDLKYAIKLSPSDTVYTNATAGLIFFQSPYSFELLYCIEIDNYNKNRLSVPLLLLRKYSSNEER